MPRHKRHRGGQPGNQNARKHGFYSPYLNGSEYRELQKALRKGAADERLVAIRIKMQSALRYNPTDPRLYREASKLLMDWFRSHYDFSATSVKEFRSNTRDYLNAIRQNLAATIEANSKKSMKKLPEQIKLNRQKIAKNDVTNRS